MNAAEEFDTLLRHPEHRVNYHGINIVAMDGVFTPNPDISLTSTMVATGPESFEGKSVLDMGCGTAALSVYAASRGAKKVVAVDIDDRALENSRLNVGEHRYAHIVDVRKSDLFINVSESFDVIVANLPINDELWSATTSTVSVVERFLAEYRQHLNPRGKAYLAWGSFGDVDGLRYVLKKTNVNYKERKSHERGYDWYLFVLEGDK